MAFMKDEIHKVPKGYEFLPVCDIVVNVWFSPPFPSFQQTELYLSSDFSFPPFPVLYEVPEFLK